MAKRVLMITYHYPPCAGVGVRRALNFSRHLPAFGWQPSVLTLRRSAYGDIDRDSEPIPEHVEVHRSWAIDATQTLSIAGRYPDFVALPDKYASWWLAAVPAGWSLIRKRRPDVLWSTFPIPSAHLVALTLHRLTGVPWVADFRDPISDTHLVPISGQKTVLRWLDRQTVRASQRVVLTTDSVAELYAQRYPARPREQWAVIANGYGESDFESGDQETSPPVDDRPIHLVHSGFLYPFYPPGRNPKPFFEAVARLRDAGALSSETLKVTLRGCGDVAHYQRLIDEAGVGDIVAATGSIPRREAIRELRQVDGVLVFQGSPFNPQVPVKVYEALRANKPILALTDEAGETARFVRSSKVGLVAQMDSSEAIAKALKDLLERLRSGTAPTASPEEIARHSYLNRTAELARLFDEVVEET